MLSLIHHVSARPWAIQGEIAAHVRGLLMREGIAGLRHLAALKAGIHAYNDDDHAPRAAAGRRPGQLAGTVAVIPIIGTMTQRGDVIDSAETRSTSAISDEVTAAAADPKIDAILLETDSPGGEVYGVPEAWAAIRDARKAKPVVAIANSVAASAAYYLASAADEVWVTPSGEVGSIGVYALHVDASKALADIGERWDFIVATDSPYKVEGNPAGPLTDEARTWLQKAVDRYMEMFVRDVAKGRGVTTKAVIAKFGGGRMLGAEAAVEQRMADGVGTFDMAVRRALDLVRERGRGGPAAKASADAFIPPGSSEAPTFVPLAEDDPRRDLPIEERLIVEQPAGQDQADPTGSPALDPDAEMDVEVEGRIRGL